MRARNQAQGAALDQLRALPFVRDLVVEEPSSGPDGHARGTAVVVRTATADYRLLVEAIGSNLTYPLAARLVGHVKAGGTGRRLVLAPYIPAPMARYLAGEGVDFIDGVGNCSLSLGQNYVANVEGRRLKKSVEQAGLRAASYQVLFVLLADPEAVNRSVRELAALAGASKSTVAQTLHRLVVEGFIGRQGERRKLLNGKILLDRWLGGYAEVLRPRWFRGRYEVGSTSAFEDRVRARLGSRTIWAWSGGAAALRLTGHYRGPETVLCIGPPAVTTGDLGLLADEEGPVSILQPEGTLAFQGKKPETVHPLLVYGELLARPSERAAEAAEEVRRRWLPGLGT